MRAGVAVPIAVDGSVIGALAALGPSADAALMRTATEVARFVSTHLRLLNSTLPAPARCRPS